MKTKTNQKVATVSSLILGLILGLSNQPAQATGSRCAPFGKNSTCLTVNGSGLAVNSLKAWFTIDYTQRCIPNWKYRISFKDKNNNEYAHINGPIHPTCNQSGQLVITYSPSYKAKEGSICASLYDFTDTFIASACVPITP